MGTATWRSDLTEEITSARRSLVATLASLSEEAWARGSLCDGWAVRDVVGHLLHQYDIYRAPYPRAAVVRARFRINRFLAIEAKRYAFARSNPELVEDLRRAEYERTTFWRHTPWPEFALTEFVIHSQDIRRPLGIEDRPTTSELTIAAEVFAGGTRRPNPLRRVFQRKLPETHFQATDVEWSHGSGPLAQGPLEAIVMVLAGRPQALVDLSGDGVAPLERALS
jgi:uncharacterized protein (TIGR03083 family)